MESILAPTPLRLPPPDVIRQTANEILSRPEYRPESIAWDLTPIFQWFPETLREIFSPITSALDAAFELSPLFGWFVIVALGVILGGVIAHLIYSMRVALGGGRREGAPLRLEGELANLPETWEQGAEEAFSRNEYIKAIRSLFRAGLLRLEYAQRVRLVRGATNREYLEHFRDTPVFEPLLLFVEMIDTKWYGDSTCGLADYQQCVQAHVAIRRIAEEKPDAHLS